MSPSYLQGPGSFRFDVNLMKKIRVVEGKELEVRGDADQCLEYASNSVIPKTISIRSISATYQLQRRAHYRAANAA